MPKILSRETRPYYAQVALFDPTVKSSYPDWGDGAAEVVFGPNGVAVETRPDHLGPVAIEVWTDSFEGAESLRAVGTGHITVAGNQGVLVGSVTGNDLHVAPVPAGKHRIVVLANSERGEVDGIFFVFPDVS